MYHGIDITGQRFGRLQALEPVRVNGHLRWRCVCDCGGDKVTRTATLRNGNALSCGCLQKERAGAAHTTHGHGAHGSRRTSEYSIWSNILQRCTNPKTRSYMDYGGRGIDVCQRWLKFENFLADMGKRPVGLSLDRIDNDGNYEPGNCRWADKDTQSKNRRSVRKLTAEVMRLRKLVIQLGGTP